MSRPHRVPLALLLALSAFASSAQQLPPAYVARLGAQQLSTSALVLARLIDGWLDDLEAMLASVTDAEIDPRFVEGVLVEVRRS